MLETPLERCCVCDVVCGGAADYRPAQVRLRENLKKFCPGMEQIFWLDEFPPGSPTHTERPYAFKYYAVLEAVRRGYTQILWMDSRCFFNADPAAIFERAGRLGVCTTSALSPLALWCARPTLVHFGITVERAQQLTMAGGTFCLNMAVESGAAVFQQMLALTKQPHLWNGTGFAKHRFDEACMTCVLHSLGLSEAAQDLPEITVAWATTPPRVGQRVLAPATRFGAQATRFGAQATTPPAAGQRVLAPVIASTRIEAVKQISTTYQCFGATTSYQSKAQMAQGRRLRFFSQPKRS